MIDNPYCIHSWSEVKSDIDFDNLTMLDKILLATKEMSELGINDYQCWGKPCKYLNEVFGLLKGEFVSCEYGVQHVWMAGYDCRGYSARIPRIHVNYNRSFYDEYTVYIGDSTIPKSTNKHTHRYATEKEIEAVYKYMLQLIEDRKEEIEKAKRNPTFDEFRDKCFEIAKAYVDKDYPMIDCDLMYGSNALEKTLHYSIVLHRKGIDKNTIISQLGYITPLRNEYNEYTLKVRSLGSGGYSIDIKDSDTLNEEIEKGIYFLMN